MAKINTKQLEKEARKALKTAKAKFKAAEVKVNSAIKKDPKKAVLIAAAAGAAVGAVLTYALKRRKQ